MPGVEELKIAAPSFGVASITPSPVNSPFWSPVAVIVTSTPAQTGFGVAVIVASMAAISITVKV